MLHVAIELLQERALLLPQVCTVFLSKCGAVSNPSQLYLEVGDSEVQFSSRGLLHQLIVYLHSYMRYKCIHKRFDVILYRNGGDLLQTLSWELGRNVTHIQQRMAVNHHKQNCTHQNCTEKSKR